MPPTDPQLRLARHIAELLMSLTEADIQSLNEGRAELKVVDKDRSDKKRVSKPPQPSADDLRAVLDYLHQAPDRESGVARIERDVPTKAGLESLSRMADLPVQKSDTVSDLKQRIIEATIGYRLRSRAVRGSDGP